MATPIKNPPTPHATQVTAASLVSVLEIPACRMEGAGAESVPLDAVNSALAVDESVILSNPIMGGLELVAP